MAVAGARSLAGAGPARVYAAIGANARQPVEDLALHSLLCFEQSVRHANLLLVAGEHREEDRLDLQRLHDQMPHPRATLWWMTEQGAGADGAIILGARAEAAALLAATGRQLLCGERASEPDLLPNLPPAPWKGLGEYGQGGKGMMGGKPYGRPMAMTDDDHRDGLALDVYTASLGPFVSILPPGLKMEVTLQGDVIQAARIERAPLRQAPGDVRPEPLRRIARLLRLMGLTALAERFIRADYALSQGQPVDMRALRRRLDWSGAWYAIPPGLGVAGSHDVRTRLQGWWQEAEQHAGAASSPPAAPPRSHAPSHSSSAHAPSHSSSALSQAHGAEGEPEHRLTELLQGLEWNEAMLVINSFDDEALARMCPVTEEKSEKQDHARQGHGHE